MSFRRAPHPELAQLDSFRDHQRIVFITSLIEFPWDCERALEFALFRTFAIPSIGGLLARTGEFTERTQKRYDDTELLIAEFIEDGYDGPRGKRAIARMNRIHARYKIANADSLYTLGTFVCEPKRWLDQFSWRPLMQKERDAVFTFWMEVGKRMHLSDLPETYNDLEAFYEAYERDHFGFHEGAQRVALAARDLILAKYLPEPLQAHGALAVHALMDDPLLEALRLERPPAWLRKLVVAVLKARTKLWAYGPEQRVPTRLTQVPRPTYPRGYTIEALGPKAP
jgi:hypothetical protein